MESIQVKLETDGAYKNLYATFGVIFQKGVYEKLLTPTGVKDYVTNDNRLKNGTQYVTDSFYSKRKARELSLPFFLESSSEAQYFEQLEAFLDFMAGGLVYLKVPKLKRVYKVVYMDCERFGNYSLKHATFTLKLIEPDPTDRETLE